MKRTLAGILFGFFLLGLMPVTTGCMTTQKEARQEKRQERTAKKSKKARTGNYGLVGAKSKLDRGHLRRGQKAMFSNALDSY